MVLFATTAGCGEGGGCATGGGSGLNSGTTWSGLSAADAAFWPRLLLLPLGLDLLLLPVAESR